MTDERRPWGKFYWSDWRANKELRMCGFAARGLWMDMLTLMAEGQPYGHLTINGKAPTPRQLSGLLGGGETEVSALLAELEENGVPGVNPQGVWYSRRMVRDRAKEDADKANGKKGGNPELLKTPEGGSPPKPENREKGVKAQKPEARSQKPEEIEAGDRADSGGRTDYPDDFEAFWKAYPRSPNDPKAVAFKAWQKVADALPASDVIVACVEAYKRFVIAENSGRKSGEPLRHCHSATWLNQRRWEGFQAEAEAKQQRATEAEERRRAQIPKGGEWEAAAARFITQHGAGAWDAAVMGCQLIEGDPLTIEYAASWRHSRALHEDGSFEQLRRAAGADLRATIRSRSAVAA